MHKMNFSIFIAVALLLLDELNLGVLIPSNDSTNDSEGNNSNFSISNKIPDPEDELVAMELRVDFQETDPELVSNETMPDSCDRGFHLERNSCQKTTFGFEGGIVSNPECETHQDCPINARCDGEEKLCSCIKGQPIGEANCEAASLGEYCDDNMICKSSLLYECLDNKCVCKTALGLFQVGSLCLSKRTLDNECEKGGVPCFGDNVACINGIGEKCSLNESCVCRCENGFSKNQLRKTCEKIEERSSKKERSQVPTPPPNDEEAEDEDSDQSGHAHSRGNHADHDHSKTTPDPGRASASRPPLIFYMFLSLLVFIHLL